MEELERYISCISPIHPRKAHECLQNRTFDGPGIHYVFHACMPDVQLAVFRPGVQLVVFGYLLSIIVVLWRRWVGGVAPSVLETCQDIYRLY